MGKNTYQDLVKCYTPGFELKQLLYAASNPKCKRCHGSGISNWRRRGFRACICICAVVGMKEIKEAVELEEREKMELEVKGNSTANPSESDTVNHLHTDSVTS